MTRKFTARRPKARKAPVAPLQESSEDPAQPTKKAETRKAEARPKEVGGPSGPEPTRYGDWERKGICVDF